MSTAMNISEKDITIVIDHQFTTLIDNMPSCNSLEISGFGKFMFHKHKAPKTMLNYLNQQKKILETLSNDPCARNRAEIKLSNLELKKKALNQKLQSYENQFCTDLGRLEKFADSPREDEGAYPNSSK